jgi:NAD(P)-dependent dehydrogenase (short-subunit alcohol dehydrogenase family)
MFTDHVAVISGSAMGIGRGIAVGLAQRGVNTVCLDIDAAGNAQTAEQVRSLGGQALALTCDVGDRSQVQAAFDKTLRTFGRIDILINNAAVWLDCALTTGTYESQTEAFARSMNSCALGSYYCAMAAVPAMISGGGGNIINIVTEHIKAGRYITGMPASGYDCAKFSQWRLTETWAVELKKHRIRVNALCTGAVDTPMLRSVSTKTAEAGMKVEDMAAAVINVLAHGPGGPTGQSYPFGFTGTPRETSLREIAALAP